MKKLLVVFVLMALSGCASLNGQNQLTPQGEAAILALIQIATGVAAGTTTTQGGVNAACATVGTVLPLSSPCVPSPSTDPVVLQAAIQACLLYSVEQAAILRVTAKLCTPTTATGK